MALPVLGGTMRSIDVIQWDLAQARHVDASAVLAGILEQSLRAQVMMSPRPRQDAPLRVLTGVNMPAALIEMAYLSNADQERLAQSEAYQSSVAQAIYNAIVGFRVLSGRASARHETDGRTSRSAPVSSSSGCWRGA